MTASLFVCLDTCCTQSLLIAGPLYYRPRVTLINALAHIAPLTVRTLLYGNDTFEFEENKIIITETLRFIKESKRFD